QAVDNGGAHLSGGQCRVLTCNARKESQDSVGAIDRFERSGAFTAAIRIQDRISGQYLHERLSVARRDGLVKGDCQTAGFVGWSGGPWSTRFDVFARTRCKLATVCLST